ncbi:NAD(P)-dependent dehydrogenase (short-subunit alcohol dehydrogenase family) [Actinomadura coerulea]|uniref:NAD(P)-dependent dehydrogenase (Short-subunit alcohol dehydrogenase family) n=1 Tax=Actinomadura coerulea TaxID=46159 RepID=A0A7X0L042_9ACTN|nr:hypothetical protein [Actinomadura coerulea]MBB6397095.1 NAD(P)-dependent dehydrogenase (short-subunit alcohol dehydrogenase family) [Actinomadura coerulea]
MVPLFAERWKDAGVTIDAVHPGVLRTDLTTRGGPFGLLMRAVKPALKPVGRAAPPVVDLVDSAGTGRYFHVAKEKPLKARAREGALARRLWHDAEIVLAAVYPRDALPRARTGLGPALCPGFKISSSAVTGPLSPVSSQLIGLQSAIDVSFRPTAAACVGNA